MSYQFRSKILDIMDFLTFPIRALFMMEDGRFGLSSLRDERMRVVASFSQGKVLDIGCGPGNLFIKNFIGQENGIGIDLYPYEGIEKIVEDMAQLPFEDNTFDTVTLIAVGGHIPKSKRSVEFKEFGRVLKPGGKLIMTEGEPVTQYINHKWADIWFRWQGKEDMDSERGMAEDEEYCMPYKEIQTYLNMDPLRLEKCHRFMWGLNNIYVAHKARC